MANQKVLNQHYQIIYDIRRCNKVEKICKMDKKKSKFKVKGGSFMSAHVLLNLLNELKKRDKMRGMPSILSPFRKEFNKFNDTGARMLNSIYHLT